MRILIINTYYYPNLIGGTEHVIKKLSEEALKNGNEVAILTCDSKEKLTKENINGIIVYRSTGRNITSPFVKNKLLKKFIYKCIELKNYAFINDLKKVLNDFNPEVVHTNNIFCMSPYVWKYISKKNIKIVHTVHDYWLMCPRATLRNNKNKNCVSPKLLCRFYRLYMKKCSKYVDTATFPSLYLLNIFKNAGYFYKADLKCINNAIEYDETEVNKLIDLKTNRNDEIIQFMFIGNLLRTKGIEFMISAFKSIKEKNIKLVICGSGELDEFVKEQCKEDDRIIYMGRVEGNEKRNVFQQSDVLFIPSIWNEPFGMVILEAYANAMPVIASNVGGIPEIVIDGITGVVVPSGNNEELRRAIVGYLNRDNIKANLPNILQVLNNFHISNQAKMFLKVYKDDSLF